MKNNLQRGSLVVCDYNFDRERMTYKQHPYPYKGDLLIVSGLMRHYDGQLLCTFEELKNKLTIPLGAICFKELQTPEEGDAIISHFKKYLTK